MNYRRHHFRFTALVMLVVWGTVLVLAPAVEAQDSTAPVTEAQTPLTRAELEELAGPIALYPDDLVSIVLPASTHPLQIVQAARYLEEHKTNTGLKPNDNWDDSVVALLNYPEVIEFMNADLDWTSELGEAAIYQQTELLDAIQDFRDRAYAAGNLQSDKRQVVTKKAETIVIEPANPTVIYVPYYEPRDVLVYQPYPVYYYYSRAYPVYYYPYPYGYSFGLSYFWGVTIAFSIDWHSHYVKVYDHLHYAHPYYGHYYHYPLYRRHPVSVGYRANIWRPRYRSDSRQKHTASVIGAKRKLDATAASKAKYRTQNDKRLRPSAPRTASRVTRSNRIDRGRNQPALNTRPVTKRQSQPTQSSGKVKRRSEALARTRTTKSTTSRAERQRSQPSQVRTQPARTLGGVRPNQSSSSQSRRRTVSAQRNQPSLTPQRSAPRRQQTLRTAPRGTSTYGGVATRSTPSSQPGSSTSFRSHTRSGAGPRSQPNFDRRGNNERRKPPNT